VLPTSRTKSMVVSATSSFLLGLKPALIVNALRGAEAPLCHVYCKLSQFFRNLRGRAQPFWTLPNLNGALSKPFIKL
ncbi:MAG: hypothetical protein WB368_01055, partial [Candidatus Sulfotelmatobacter sp.]